MNWYDWVNENVVRPEFSGPAGALLGLLNAPGKTMRERAFNLGAGLSVAVFLSPVVDSYFNVTTRNQQTAVAFVIGLLGMNLVAKAIDYVRQTSVSDILSTFRRTPPLPPEPPKDS